MDPWTLTALVLILVGCSAVVAPGPTKRAGALGLQLGGQAVRATARFGKPYAGKAFGWLWSGARSRLGGLAQWVADMSRTSGNPATAQPVQTRLDKVAGWLRGPTPEQLTPPAPTKPSLAKPARAAKPVQPEPKGTYVMSDVTNRIAAAFDQLADLDVDTVAELEELLGDLSIMWARVGISVEQFLNNQEAAGVASKPLRAAFNSLDGIDHLSTGARDARRDLRNYYEAYFDQIESGKSTKVGLLDPAKGRNAA